MSTDPAAPPAQPQQPPAGQLFVLNPGEFTPHEVETLRAAGYSPDDFCLLLTSPLQMQAVAQNDASGQVVIVFQMVAAVPHAVLPFPLRGIVDAQGNTPTGSKVRESIPLPPAIRLMVKRDALAPHVRTELDRARLLHTLQQTPGEPS